jgi:putative membrane protein
MKYPKFLGVALGVCLYAFTPAAGAQQQSTQPGQDRSGQTTDRDRSATGSQTQSQTGSQTESQAGSQTSSQTQSQTGSDMGAQSGALSQQEAKFIREAAAGSMAEIEFGKMAKERAGSEQVKELAEKLEEDHSKSLEKLKEIAQSNNIDVPSDLPSKQQKTTDRLSKLSGSEFDAAFVREVHKHHNKDISKYKKMQNRARNEELKEYVSNTLPKLQEHHDAAQTLRSSIEAASRPAEANGRSSDGTDPTTRDPYGNGTQRRPQSDPRIPQDPSSGPSRQPNTIPNQP